MRKLAVLAAASAVLLAGASAATAQGITRNGPDGNARALSGAAVHGGLDYAESCSYDPVRDLVVVPNQGMRTRDGVVNDGWVALVNHDGTMNTFKWIQGGGDDTSKWINDPFGSDIVNGVLYLGDSIGDPAHGVVTMWDMETGEMLGMHEIPDAGGVNDLEATEDGTVFTSWHGSTNDPSTWTFHRIDPDGTTHLLIQGEDSHRPNGIAFDADGNVVVVNLLDDEVNTYDVDGNLLGTRHAAEGRNDGLVIMDDGTLYITSVSFGSIHVLRPDDSSEVLAVGIPSAASMCYDAGANTLVVPMNNNDALAIHSLN